MRILIVTEPSGGGSGRHVIDLCRGLVDMGHDVDLIYSTSRSELSFVEQINGVKNLRTYDARISREIGINDFLAALRIWKYIRRRGPFDVIHAHSSKAGALVRMIPTGASRIVYTPHALKTMDPGLGEKSKFLYSQIEKFLARIKKQRIIAVSSSEYDHMLHLGLEKKNLRTIYNGLSSIALDRDAARERLGIKNDHSIVGFVGRLCDQKDPLKFATVIETLVERGLRVEGLMLGDGELRGGLVGRGNGHLAIHSGLEARPLMAAFDCLLMTSKFEAMPYVLIEALHAGLPIVTTDVGGALDAVEQNVNGLVLPSSASPAEIADAVEKAISSGSKISFGEESLRRAKKFSLEEMLSATISIYNDRSWN